MRIITLILFLVCANTFGITPGEFATTKEKAEKGDAQAQCNLGIYFYEGDGVSKNQAEAVKWFRKSAEQGNALAQNKLGDCYYEGKGVSKDFVEAVKWFRKAVEQGDAEGQKNLGVCYAEGKGVLKDPIEAVKWYRKSAEQGNAEGQCGLGDCYAEGEGVLKDPIEAVKWYRKSAEQNNSMGQLSLGICYYKGNGVSKDPVEAVKWYRKSAVQGNGYAQFFLGICYGLGLGVDEDPAELVFWCRESARQGNLVAQNVLASCYYKGAGVTRDPVEAYAYYLNYDELVAEPFAERDTEKSVSAEQLRKELKGELLPWQIVAAQKRSKELLALIRVQREAKEESKAVIHPGKISKENNWWEFNGYILIFLIICLILAAGVIIKQVTENELVLNFGFLIILLLGFYLIVGNFSKVDTNSVVKGLVYTLSKSKIRPK